MSANQNQMKIVDESFEPRPSAERKEEESAALRTATPCPNPPDWLSYEAKLEWVNAAPQFHEAGLLFGAFETMFANYCSLIGDILEAEAMLQADGRIINAKPHPMSNQKLLALKEARMTWGEMFSLLEAKRKQEEEKEKERLAKEEEEKAKAEAEAASQEQSGWFEEDRKRLLA